MNEDDVKDLFLSYSRADTDAVVAIRNILQARGISTFFDREQLLAGMPWPQALEKGLRGTRGVAVFIGPSGLGLWQKREMSFALDRQVTEERNQGSFPVIPILLPGADLTPGFLFLNTWVDLRADLADADSLDALCRGAKGERDQESRDESGSLCPYQGLRPFNEESAAFFCGREAFSLRIKEAVLQRSLVAVIGPSGSGKSSIVQAGVLPLLRRQHPPAATWDAAAFIPGDRPFYQLAAALLPLLEPNLAETEWLAETQKLAQMLSAGNTLLHDVVDRILIKSGGTDRLLLVADQFEELFTLCPDAERQRFLEALLQAGDRSRLSLVLTMRGSFYDRLIGVDRRISDRLENAVINLGPMTREELHKAIVDPAKRLGLNFEPGLAKRMLDDVGDEPGNLPLMEFALTELWARRQARSLTHAAYEQIGGVAGAIVQRAESVFSGLSSAQQETAKGVLIRLVWIETAVGTQHEARQRIPLDELKDEAKEIVQIMADARLLVMGQHGSEGQFTVEVAHEALIRQWARLREWLDEDREFLLWRRRLYTGRENWKQDPKDKESLLRGTPLHEAERWLTLRGEYLDEEEDAFIRASLAVDERERLLRDRRRRRYLVTSIGLSVVFLFLAGMAALQSMTALSQELAAHARSQLYIDPERSLMLGIEAVKAEHTQEAGDVLKLALQSSLLVSREDKLDFLTRVVFSPDGKTIMAMGKDKRPRVWNWDGKRLTESAMLQKLPHPINDLALNPDWTMAATINADLSVSLVDVVSGRMLCGLEGHQEQVVKAEFSPDGTKIATASDDGTARIFDVKACRSLQILRGHKDRLSSASFSPDGTRIVTASLDETASIWDVENGRRLQRLLGHHSIINNARFSPDGKQIVTSSGDNTGGIWDAQSGKLLARLEGHSDSVTFATFSPVDSGLIVTISRDRTGRVWKRLDSPSDWESINELHGHTDILTAVAFAPKGGFIVTAGRDRSVRVWKAMNEHGRQALYGHKGAVHGAEFSPDGRWLVSASSDNTARLWDRNNPQNTMILSGHKDSLSDASFSRDGAYIVTTSDDNLAKIWDARTGKLLHTLTGHEDNVNMAKFDPLGERVVTASDDNTARIWAVESGALLHVLDGKSDVKARTATASSQDIAFSPNGTLVATLESNQTARIREVGTGKTLAMLKAHAVDISSVAFSPRGDRLATADRLGQVRLWDTKTWQSVIDWRGHEGPVTGIAFRGDGEWLATAGEDRKLCLWEVTTGRLKGEPFIHDAPLTKAEFSLDGKTLIGSTINREINWWNIETGKRIGVVCPDCQPLGGHNKRVTSAEFSPDGTKILTASRDGSARIWDAASGRVSEVLDHKNPLIGARFNSDGSLVLTLSRDHTARLWRKARETFEPAFSLDGHGDELTSGEFSSDGHSIATASRDGSARVWETATGKPVYVMQSHQDWINGVAFSPDDGLLVTAGRDGVGKVWDLHDGSLKMELRGHDNSVNRARFNNDGSAIVTASRDGTVRVWNLKDIQEKRICPECSGSIADICKLARDRSQRLLSREEKKKYHLPWFIDLFDLRCPG